MISKDKILCMEEEVESVNFGINKGKKLSAIKQYKYKHFNGRLIIFNFPLYSHIYPISQQYPLLQHPQQQLWPQPQHQKVTFR